ncbi:MAG: hypothetical protein ACK5SX_15055 [Sandaracinobacter sp.]
MSWADLFPTMFLVVTSMSFISIVVGVGIRIGWAIGGWVLK